MLTTALVIFVATMLIGWAALIIAKRLPDRPVQPSDYAKLGWYRVACAIVAVVSNIAYLCICVILLRSLWPRSNDLRVGFALIVFIAALSSVANLFKSVVSIRAGWRVVRLA